MQNVKHKQWPHVSRICIFLLAMLIIFPSAVSCQETYRFERMWPTLLQPWYFNDPLDVAIGPDGSIYIADSGYYRIQKFTQDGKFINKWGKEGTGDGEFGTRGTWGLLPSGPNDIAIDNNGNVYVADTHNNRIQKFTSDGVFLNKWGEGIVDGNLQHPSGIAVDKNGYVYVSEYDNHRIQKFTSGGSFVTKWGSNGGDGSSGGGDGEFLYPNAVGIDTNGYVYVADSFNYRIQKFTADGAFVTKWDNTFPGGARFGQMHDIAIDAIGNMYVTDIGGMTNLAVIHKIDIDGHLLADWLIPSYVSGIAVDENHVYVTNLNGPISEITKLTLDGTILNRWAGYETGEYQLQSPQGIAISSDGTIYVSDSNNYCIHVYTSEGVRISPPWGEGGSGTGQFNDPHGMAVDDSGNLYVSDTFNFRIQKFRPDGQFVTSLENGDDLSWITDGTVIYSYWYPNDVALDSTGNVYAIGALHVRVEKLIHNPPEEVRIITEDLYPSEVQKFRPNSEGTGYDFVTMWREWGAGLEFRNSSGIAIGRDIGGTEYFYVADTGNNYIHKFTLNGDYITTWMEAAPGYAFSMPIGLATDDSGNVYINDSWNCRFLKFTSGGELIASLGSCGSGPGQISEYHYLAVDGNEKVYVADTFNNRIQVFAKAESIENSKAIIVAGGGSYPGNSLWDATQMCANFAYRALTYQGFTKEDITYLSEDTDLDLDNNGLGDDVSAAPTNQILGNAIQQAAIDNTENLVLYLTDHGGADESGGGTFHLGGSEFLTAANLAAMLDAFPGRAIVIIDACQSGSFMTALEGINRIIITSTGPGEQAKFINQGTISFSNFFWTGVFNGSTLLNSFNTARGAVNVLASQIPQIWPTDVSPNIYIGNGVAGMTGDAPEIGGIVTSPPELHLETQAVLHADNITDPDGIARVWAVIWPPHYDPGSVANPLITLPSVDLLPVEGEEGNYAVAYSGFTAMGIYQIAVYAMDRKGNTSQPKFMPLSRSLIRRAVIVGGGAGGEPSRAIIEKNTSLAYNAFTAQRYDPDEDIYFMSVTGISGVDVAPSVFYLGTYLEDLATNGGVDNLDLTIYLIGLGDTGTFAMNDGGEMLTASQLDAWLDDLQNRKQSRVTFICDGNKSGSFIPALTPPEGKERIIITSTGPESAAYFKTEGSISFSSFFWDRVASGATIGDAFLYAKGAISYCTRENDISFSCYRPQHPLINADGNGIANEPDDYALVQGLHLGDGIVSADEPPIIGSVAVTRQGNLLSVTAEDLSSTDPVEKVWAVIRPIGYCPGTSEGLPQEVFEPELFDPDGDGTYEGSFDVDYACKVTVYAMSRVVEGEPNISSPSEPIINQPGGDIYEDPDGNGIPDDYSSEANVIVVNHPSPQPHTFHHPDDVDWVKFYAVSTEEGHTYTIEAGNLEANCPVIELYKEDNLTEPVAVHNGYPVHHKVWFDFDCTHNALYQEGIYYVKFVRGDCAYTEGEMGYDLQVYDGNIGLTALIAGRVEDMVSGKPIDGAVITSSGVGAAISTQGEYILSEIVGSWIISAAKERYATFRDSIMIESRDEYIRKDITMYPINATGCVTAADCDDGLFCSGTESCVDRTCQPGKPPCSDDGIFCNGQESCNEANDVCQNSGNPCLQGLTCDEERDVCAGCLQDADCDDGLFCTGIETCVDGDCLDGTNPCPEGVECDEETDTCLMPSISVTPQRIMQSRWMPLPLFMSIRGTNTHFSGASKVTFTPPSVMGLPMLINQETIFCLGLIMPVWVTGQLGDSIEVSVSTGAEAVSEILGLRLLPFVMVAKNHRR